MILESKLLASNSSIHKTWIENHAWEKPNFLILGLKGVGSEITFWLENTVKNTISNSMDYKGHWSKEKKQRQNEI